ncbi:MAG TPA: transglutaminase family protein, partial [Thermoanaerobaculia bacterium]
MQGRVLTHPAFARQRFREITGRPDPSLDLVEASLVIALEDDPGIEIDAYLAQVNSWTDAVRERLEGSRDVEHIVESINRLLFEEEGFHGKDEDYYDPRSALLNATLDTHA